MIMGLLPSSVYLYSNLATAWTRQAGSKTLVLFSAASLRQSWATQLQTASEMQENKKEAVGKGTSHCFL